LRTNNILSRNFGIFFISSIFVFLILLLNINFLRADFFLNQWPYYKNIYIDKSNLYNNIIEIKIDSEIYEKAHTDLKDLRIVTDNEHELPYSIQVKSGSINETYLKNEILENSFSQNQFNRVLLDLGKSAPIHNQVNVIILSENFKRKVSIESSNDKNQWKKIGSGEISDFTSPEFSFRNTAIKYIDSKSQFLRITINDDSKRELLIKDVEVLFSKEIIAEETAWDILNSKVINNQSLSLTTLSLDLGFEGIPTSKALINIDSENFYRFVDVRASKDKRNWEKIVNNQPIFSFSDGESLILDNIIEYPEIENRYIEIVIYNEDDLPLNIIGYNITGTDRSLIFEADLDNLYSVYYGNLNGKKVSYDIKYFLERIDTSNSYQAKLGIEQKNTFFLDKVSFFDKYSWIMPAILAFAVIIMGVRVISTIRKIKINM